VTDVIRKIALRLQYKKYFFSIEGYIEVWHRNTLAVSRDGLCWSCNWPKMFEKHHMYFTNNFCEYLLSLVWSCTFRLFRSLGFSKEAVFSFKSCCDMPLSMFHLLFWLAWLLTSTMQLNYKPCINFNSSFW